eukprot:CAMPEP_0182846486 /NCGR_PEP_ID=MMETSP0006_2-20121128/27924_1 /TAXON_ID=97485 /ORGANISM="Prymnesium parvum, Strain Texoma1" /LENGTH=65 /DNA_ID=CAMNT_0024976703 /DNA_START=219 /DNA_END=413 /DNA_ORIENTATION=+
MRCILSHGMVMDHLEAEGLTGKKRAMRNLQFGCGAGPRSHLAWPPKSDGPNLMALPTANAADNPA